MEEGEGIEDGAAFLMIARGSDHEGQSFLFLFALTKEIVKNLCS